jgi:diguanylate cyclase (GGDEF)-like protein
MRIQTYLADSKRRQAEATIRLLIALGRAAALVVVMGGALLLTAWLFDISWILQPTASEPPSRPLTAFLFVVAGSAAATVRTFRVPSVARVLLALVMLVAALRILVALVASPSIEEASVLSDSLGIGWHAAVMFILVSAAFLVRSCGYPRCGQLVGMAGLALPLISITGYAYGIEQLHGAMSPATTLLGIIFAATPFLLSARTGFMRALSSPWDGGRYGRIQIASIAGLLFVGGLLLQRHSLDISSHLAAYVVTSILLLTLISGYSAIAIERSDYSRRAAERVVAQLVLHDPLTALYNRRFLKEQAGSIVAFAQRHRLSLSLLMIDIDHFKRINDDFGHQIGDVVLQRVSNVLKTRLRRGDVAVRYGGEELLAVLPGADLTDATAIAEQLRIAVGQIDYSDIGQLIVTVSIGVAAVRTTLQEAVGHADGALYRAKKAGRNRVVGATDTAYPHIRLAAG